MQLLSIPMSYVTIIPPEHLEHSISNMDHDGTCIIFFAGVYLHDICCFFKLH